MTWKLADAKNRFSEVVNRALSEGPQHISRRSDRVVLLSESDYRKLTGPRPSFRAFLAAAPAFPEELQKSLAQRDPTPPRDAGL